MGTRGFTLDFTLLRMDLIHGGNIYKDYDKRPLIQM
jgi:hypothetical protein